MDLGRTVYTRDKTETGTIVNLIEQHCACCGTVKVKLVAKWKNGKKTFLCPKGLKYIGEGEKQAIQIL